MIRELENPFVLFYYSILVSTTVILLIARQKSSMALTVYFSSLASAVIVVLTILIDTVVAAITPLGLVDRLILGIFNRAGSYLDPLLAFSLWQPAELERWALIVTPNGFGISVALLIWISGFAFFYMLLKPLQDTFPDSILDHTPLFSISSGWSRRSKFKPMLLVLKILIPFLLTVGALDILSIDQRLASFSIVWPVQTTGPINWIGLLYTQGDIRHSTLIVLPWVALFVLYSWLFLRNDVEPCDCIPVKNPVANSQPGSLIRYAFFLKRSYENVYEIVKTKRLSNHINVSKLKLSNSSIDSDLVERLSLVLKIREFLPYQIDYIDTWNLNSNVILSNSLQSGQLEITSMKMLYQVYGYGHCAMVVCAREEIALEYENYLKDHCSDYPWFHTIKLVRIFNASQLDDAIFEYASIVFISPIMLHTMLQTHGSEKWSYYFKHLSSVVVSRWEYFGLAESESLIHILRRLLLVQKSHRARPDFTFHLTILSLPYVNIVSRIESVYKNIEPDRQTIHRFEAEFSPQFSNHIYGILQLYEDREGKDRIAKIYNAFVEAIKYAILPAQIYGSGIIISKKKLDELFQLIREKAGSVTNASDYNSLDISFFNELSISDNQHAVRLVFINGDLATISKAIYHLRTIGSSALKSEALFIFICENPIQEIFLQEYLKFWDLEDIRADEIAVALRYHQRFLDKLDLPPNSGLASQIAIKHFNCALKEAAAGEQPSQEVFYTSCNQPVNINNNLNNNQNSLEIDAISKDDYEVWCGESFLGRVTPNYIELQVRPLDGRFHECPIVFRNQQYIIQSVKEEKRILEVVLSDEQTYVKKELIYNYVFENWSERPETKAKEGDYTYSFGTVNLDVTIPGYLSFEYNDFSQREKKFSKEFVAKLFSIPALRFEFDGSECIDIKNENFSAALSLWSKILKMIMPAFIDSMEISIECIHDRQENAIIIVEPMLAQEDLLIRLKTLIDGDQNNRVMQFTIAFLAAVSKWEESDKRWDDLNQCFYQKYDKSIKKYVKQEYLDLSKILKKIFNTMDHDLSPVAYHSFESLAEEAMMDRNVRPEPPIYRRPRGGMIVAIKRFMEKHNRHKLIKCSCCKNEKHEYRSTNIGLVCLDCLTGYNICASCGLAIGEAKAREITMPIGKSKEVILTKLLCHEDCYNIREKPLCDYCGLPSANNIKLANGINICGDCHRIGVKKASDLDNLNNKVDSVMAELFNVTNLSVKFSFIEMSDVVRPEESSDRKVDLGIIGLFQDTSGQEPEIKILRYLPAWLTIAVLVHEKVHVWQYRADLFNKLDKILQEGMARWIEILVLDKLDYGSYGREYLINEFGTDVYNLGYRKFKELEGRYGQNVIISCLKDGKLPL